MSGFSLDLVNGRHWQETGGKDKVELNTFEFAIHFLVGHRLVVFVFFCGGA